MQGLAHPSAWSSLDKGMRQNGSQHGGATWWRPAVVYNPDDQLYHGFFCYLLQSRGEVSEQLVGSAAATHLLGIASLVPVGAYAANQPGGKHHAVVHTIACSRHRSVIRLRQSPQANTMSPTTPPLTW